MICATKTFSILNTSTWATDKMIIISIIANDGRVLIVYVFPFLWVTDFLNIILTCKKFASF